MKNVTQHYHTLFISFALALLSSYTIAATQTEGGKIKQGGLSGTVISATSSTSGTEALYTTPASGDGVFILTQICLSPNDKVALQGSTLGILMRRDNNQSNASSIGNSGSCITFTPGLSVPAEEVLSCSHELSSGPSGCVITGILSKN